ncbi:MAG TPA: alpha/beta hydrolase-fold protein [Caldilineaceae bacterium]|nr:alpha/beta hydrolase-fold protein [Caldilineaceae bacterium]
MALLSSAATIFGTEVETRTAEAIGQDYCLSLWLPPSYSTSGASYPVLFILDAALWFGVAVSTTLALIWGQEVPEVILAGISYPHHDHKDIGGNRDRDFTPTTVDSIAGSGGAAAFLTFLETDVIPFVDANYRTLPADRSIWGTSLGGLFVLYILLERSHLFQRYMATSPALKWNLAQFVHRANDGSKMLVDRPTRLFMSIGSDEPRLERSNFDALTQAFLGRNDTNLTLQFMTLDHETHFSQAARSYVTGVRAVFTQEVRELDFA